MARLHTAAPKFLALAGLILTWVLMSELLQGLGGRYWLGLYVVHGLGYASALPVYAALRRLRSGIPWSRCLAPPPGSPPPRTLAVRIIALSILSSASGYAWYMSLAHTLASLNNAIYLSSPTFLYVAMLALGRERLTARKTIALGVCMGGVAAVALAPDAAANSAGVTETAGGYLLVLTSAAMYAAYQVYYATGCRRQRGEAEAAGESGSSSSSKDAAASSPAAASSSPLTQVETAAYMLGTIGVATLALQWPLFFILNATGAEPWSLPSSALVNTLAASAGLDTAYNGLLLFGLGVASPLEMSLGTVLVVPGTMAADAIVRGKVMSPLAGCGVGGIILGFLLLEVGVPQRLEAAVRRACCRRKKAAADAAAADEDGASVPLLSPPPAAASSEGAQTQLASVVPVA